MARVPQRPRQAPASIRGGSGFPFLSKPAVKSTSAVEESVLSATEKLLEEMSFADLTVADILRAAGVSRTTFYRYFTSKEMVISTFLQAHYSDFVHLMQPWFGRGDREPVDVLREAMLGSAQTWARHRPIMRACSESWHTGQDVGQWYATLLAGFARDVGVQITRERETGCAPAGIDSDKLALGLVWGTERMYYLSSFGLFGPGLEYDVVEPVVAVWLGAIYKM
jgi:AcrR family transcriptional regulator